MKMRTRVRFGTFALAAVVVGRAAALQAQSLPPEVVNYADAVLFNGKVLTVDEKFTIAEAIAVRDDKILAVGPTQRILAMAGPDTRRIDLQGKTVTPGFIDTHLHQAWLAQYSQGGTDGRVRFQDQASGLEEVRKIAEKAKPGDWVFLSGPRNELVFSLTRQQLDQVAPNNPLAISTSTAEVVVNTAAIKAAKLTTDIPGVIAGADGQPSGQVRQAAVGIITYEMKPQDWPDIETIVPEQREHLLQYASQGLTTVIGRAQGSSISVVRELWERKELPLRVRIAHEFIMYNPNAEAFLRRMGSLRNFGDDWMKLVGATVGPVDGISSVGGILTFKPKQREANVDGGDVFGPHGQNKWAESHEDKENWAELSTERRSVILANRYGWNITAQHSTGDLSTSIYLDAFETANKEKPLQGRWGLDHMEWLNPELLTRMKNLGTVIPSFYSRLFINPEAQIYQYGGDRLHQDTVMLKTAIDMGLKPVAESDINPGPYSSPLFLIEKAITRADEKERRWNVKEAIDRQQSLRMYTSWAARYSQDEDKIGTLEAGKLADLVVLDGDYMTVAPEKISDLQVVITMVGGKISYERGVTKVKPIPQEERRGGGEGQ
jgi:predicted amidohydrolase YtcJ